MFFLLLLLLLFLLSFSRFSLSPSLCLSLPPSPLFLSRPPYSCLSISPSSRSLNQRARELDIKTHQLEEAKLREKERHLEQRMAEVREEQQFDSLFVVCFHVYRQTQLVR